MPTNHGLPGCEEHGTEWCEECKDYCFCPGNCPNSPKTESPDDARRRTNKFINQFRQGDNLKVLAYGYDYGTKRGWVEVLFEPHNDDAASMVLYSS